MPHVTLPITQEGLALPVMIGLTGQDTADLMAAGRPVPRPVLLRGVIDTATNITAVAAHALAPFGLTSVARHTTQGIGGSLPVDLFEVSLSIPPLGTLQVPRPVLPHLVVMEWVSPPPELDVLIGRDVLAHLLMLCDGPRQEFTLGD